MIIIIGCGCLLGGLLRRRAMMNVMLLDTVSFAQPLAISIPDEEFVNLTDKLEEMIAQGGFDGYRNALHTQSILCINTPTLSSYTPHESDFIDLKELFREEKKYRHKQPQYTPIYFDEGFRNLDPRTIKKRRKKARNAKRFRRKLRAARR